MVFFLKMPPGVSPMLYCFSQAQGEIHRDSSFFLTRFAALHHPQDSGTPRVEKDSVVLCGRGRWKGKPAWLIRAGELYLSTPLPTRAAFTCSQFRLQLTPRSHFLSVFETGGHCTDIYYAFQTFP